MLDQFYTQLPQAVSQGQSMAAQAIGQIFAAIWPQLWPWFLGLFGFQLVIAIYDAARGYYSAAGSLVYHVIYLSLLGGLIAFKGWGIIFSSGFEILNTVIYLVSYRVTGWVFGWSR